MLCTFIILTQGYFVDKIIGMANNPLNLLFRLLLELCALIAMGHWAANRFSGIGRIFFIILVPALAAAVWGIFRIPSESPRGRAPISVSGVVRLLIEAAYFGFAVWGLFDIGATQVGVIFGIAIIIHYALSYDRLITLLSG